MLQAFVSDHPLVVFVALISVVTFGLFGFDKFKARSGWWRTPEKTLLGFCLFGGSIGGGIGMMLFRHKISKRSFLVTYWSIVVLQVFVIGAWLFYGRYNKIGNPSETTITIEPSQPSTYTHAPYSAGR